MEKGKSIYGIRVCRLGARGIEICEIRCPSD